MAKTKAKSKNWIKDAVGKNPAVFSKKAAAAGQSTAAFAEAKASAPGKLGKEARLAKTLSKIRGKKKGK